MRRAAARGSAINDWSAARAVKLCLGLADFVDYCLAGAAAGIIANFGSAAPGAKVCSGAPKSSAGLCLDNVAIFVGMIAETHQQAEAGCRDLLPLERVVGCIAGFSDQ